MTESPSSEYPFIAYLRPELVLNGEPAAIVEAAWPELEYAYREARCQSDDQVLGMIYVLDFQPGPDHRGEKLAIAIEQLIALGRTRHAIAAIVTTSSIVDTALELGPLLAERLFGSIAPAPPPVEEFWVVVERKRGYSLTQRQAPILTEG